MFFGLTAFKTLLPLLALVSLTCQIASGFKLKLRYEECLSYQFSAYEPFFGSFVGLVDAYGNQARYDLTITAPSGTKVHDSIGQAEGTFQLVPYETGRYKFCLRVHQDRTSRYAVTREVNFDLHVGHADPHAENVKEEDTHTLWHYVNQVDQQLQQLRATQQYLYWRERRHRTTAESTHRRVMWYALLRSGTLVAVAIAQVVLIRRMFRSKRG